MNNNHTSIEDWGGKLKVWIDSNSRPLNALAVLEVDSKVTLLYQPKNGNIRNLSVAESSDGFNFSAKKHLGKIFFSQTERVDAHLLKQVRISRLEDKYIAFFQKQPENHIYSATSAGLLNWREYRGQLHLKNSGLIARKDKEDRYLMYAGGDSIYTAYSSDGSKWVQSEKGSLSKEGKVSYEVDCVLVTEGGIQVYYHFRESRKNSPISVGLVVFDSQNPEKVIWRPQETLWDSPSQWRDQEVKSLGAVKLGHKLIGYWQVGESGVWATVYTLFDSDFRFTTRKISVKLDKPSHNPILTPNPENPWEAFNTFNPAAIYLEDKVHLIYRAQGYDYVSVLGYATSKDGLKIDERFSEPIFSPKNAFDQNKTGFTSFTEAFMSGGGYGGCEDPRLTKIGDRIYMTYVAFDGQTPPRVALTSIAVSDFVNRRFFWDKPVLISPPGVVDKNAVIFPEKVGGKYVILHRIYPNILIDFVDSLDFDGQTWLAGEHMIAPRPDYWDSNKIGAGAPPIKTDDGWLLIYQAVGYQDPSKYKIGAMLLDLKNPTKVLYRSKLPILEPDTRYENEGFKAGVVYPCGAVEIDGTLFVYYGGADSYVCVATANLAQFIQELKHFELARLSPAVVRKVM